LDRPRTSPFPHQLIWPTLANAVVIMSAYLATASLISGFADASALGMISLGQAGRLTALRAGRHRPHQWQLVSARVQALCQARRRHARHRHVDWIGACVKLKIVSAPSRVMAPDSEPTHFYIRGLSQGPDGSLALNAPERIDLPQRRTLPSSFVARALRP
jgi:hypothetical protein